MTPVPEWQMDQRLALHGVHAPRSARILARLLVGLTLVTAVGLVVTPWQQTIPGAGRVTAYSPDERQQEVQALVDGRVEKWHVVEGSTIRAGDPLVDLSDNDPSILERLASERAQVQLTIDQAEMRINALVDRIAGLQITRDTSVEAAALRERMSRDRVTAAERSRTAAEASHLAASLNLERQLALIAKGLASRRNVELAQMEGATKAADVERAEATLNAAASEAASLAAELRRTLAEAGTRIDEARAQLASARSDAAKARAELAKMDVRLARQQTQRVTAPSDGTVLRVVGRRSGELLKAGETLAVIVPVSSKDVVEIWIDGNDMPMVAAGDPVRLQFEGWPALQFSGWPSVAVGTFGGRVVNVDATDNGQGRFRLLVEQDPGDAPWPSNRFLRQGVRANGWVLLNVVPVGYELWRQFNGFPPVVGMTEPGRADSGAAKSSGSPDAKDPR